MIRDVPSPFSSLVLRENQSHPFHWWSFTTLYCCLFLCLLPEVALCRVIVHDDIAVKGHRVMLKAETRGSFFADGGQVVEFFVEEHTIGKTLSGGDGVALVLPTRNLSPRLPGCIA